MPLSGLPAECTKAVDDTLPENGVTVAGYTPPNTIAVGDVEQRAIGDEEGGASATPGPASTGPIAYNSVAQNTLATVALLLAAVAQL